MIDEYMLKRDLSLNKRYSGYKMKEELITFGERVQEVAITMMLGLMKMAREEPEKFDELMESSDDPMIKQIANNKE